MFKAELDVPAGSLQCALYAFKGGADAVYLGAKQFSARKGAVNFSFEDLRKLKEYCLKNSKKFYLTVNTLIKDEKISEVVSLLRKLDYISPDGVIVQDLGVASIIRKYFPNLPLHGSTQLAVHTVEGVKELVDLGFSRVVLARELSFEEIKRIRQACPDTELKVFVHGALCYGFSGLCMASQQITGRSANNGECAQICRTWFTCRETKSDSWCFSMKDLCLGSDVRKLQEIGLDSFKVEGRMKSPEYCYWTARYYKLLLDGHDEGEPVVCQAKEAMQVSFSRENTEFFFNNKGKFVSPDFPSHRGIPVGVIRRVLNRRAEITFTKAVALRDGLLVISGKENAGFAFNNPDSGKSYVTAGETVEIDFPSQDFKSKPLQGTVVWCTSRHNLNSEKLNENIPMYSRPLNLEIKIEKNKILLNKKEYIIDVQESRNESDLTAILTKVFSSSDKSLFTLGRINVINDSGYEKPFMPLSLLKEIRRSYYLALDEEFETQTVGFVSPETNDEKLPPRRLLGRFDEVTTLENKSYICLNPLMFDEEGYFSKLDIITRENQGILVGLNNIAQVRWAKRHPEIKCFADFFLYTSNGFSYNLLKDEIPSLFGSYDLSSDTAFTYTGDDFKPPVFISRVCLRHNGLGLDCKGCSKDNIYHLEQNTKRYVAYCRNCNTTVYQED